MTALSYRTLMFSYKSTCAFKLTLACTKGNIQFICYVYLYINFQVLEFCCT